MSYSNFENPATQYLSKFILKSLGAVTVSVNSELGQIGFESSNILINSLDKIILVLLLLTLTIIIALLYCWIKTKTNWFARLVIKLDKKLRYGSIVRFLVEMSMSLSVVALVNIFYGETTGTLSIVAYVVSILLIVVVLGVTIYAAVYPLLRLESIQVFPDHNERHAFLFLEFKTHNMKCLLYYTYFTMRRILIA